MILAKGKDHVITVAKLVDQVKYEGYVYTASAEFLFVEICLDNISDTANIHTVGIVWIYPYIG